MLVGAALTGGKRCHADSSGGFMVIVEAEHECSLRFLPPANRCSSATSCRAFFFSFSFRLEASKDLCSPNMLVRVFKHFPRHSHSTQALFPLPRWEAFVLSPVFITIFQLHVSASRRRPPTSPSSCTPVGQRACPRASSSLIAT